MTFFVKKKSSCKNEDSISCYPNIFKVNFGTCIYPDTDKFFEKIKLKTVNFFSSDLLLVLIL